MADVKIVVVDGVRYREEDAPKKSAAKSGTKDDAVETQDGSTEAQHKMRTPRRSAAKS